MDWVTNPCQTNAGPLLRRLDGRDLGGIEMHLLDLDPISRNHRFRSGFGDAAVAAYVRGIDLSTGILFGAIDVGIGRIVGLAEAHPAAAPRTVAIGTSVLATHRRCGLAHKLVARAAAAALAHGAVAVELLFDPGNYAAVRIAAGLGASICTPGRAVLRTRRAIDLMLPATDEHVITGTDDRHGRREHACN